MSSVNVISCWCRLLMALLTVFPVDSIVLLAMIFKVSRLLGDHTPRVSTANGKEHATCSLHCFPMIYIGRYMVR